MRAKRPTTAPFPFWCLNGFQKKRTHHRGRYWLRGISAQCAKELKKDEDFTRFLRFSIGIYHGRQFGKMVVICNVHSELADKIVKPVKLKPIDRRIAVYF